MSFSVENKLIQNSSNSANVGNNPTPKSYTEKVSLSQKPDTFESSIKTPKSIKSQLLGALSRFSFGGKSTFVDDIEQYGKALNEGGSVDNFLRAVLNEETIQKAIDANPRIEEILNEILDHDAITATGNVDKYRKMFFDESGKPNIYIENFKNLQETHLKPTAKYAVGIAKEMGLEDDQIADLEKGMLLHDFGKVLIPRKEVILYKDYPLPSDLRAIVDLHSELGYELLKAFGVKEEISEIAKYHHSPARKKVIGNREIARVADIYSAMTEKTRSYHNGFTPATVLKTLNRMAGQDLVSNKVLGSLKTYLNREQQAAA